MADVNPSAQSEQTPEQPAKRKSPFDRVYISPGAKGKLAKFMLLHEDVYKKILMFIEQGVYDYVAAEAMGVTNWTWQDWLKRGEKDWIANKKTNYTRFFLDVRTAQSRGRLLAELEARRDDVKFWLTRGPGRTRPGRPGWTETITIGGDEELPLEVNVHGDNSLSQASTISDLAQTLIVMEQLGFIQHTDTLGKGILDASFNQPRLEADDSDPDSSSPEKSDGGYAPELEKKPPAHEGNGHGPNPDKLP